MSSAAEFIYVYLWLNTFFLQKYVYTYPQFGLEIWFIDENYHIYQEKDPYMMKAAKVMSGFKNGVIWINICYCVGGNRLLYTHNIYGFYSNLNE